ncbi:hypothetical protein HCN44_002601 [Aphidius gifuensis]|uniref:Uncharacterized protein n=1 Tax=Aphidius gifuensis TaxID=684658 RepID=A0A834Y2S0_APHGI|nr:hypothetical protein HCN44_002601 [Aphidius gifuensis]
MIENSQTTKYHNYNNKANRGSPIVCPHPNDPTRWVHVGSFAVKCDDPFDKQKDIYINIAKARKWIIQTVNDLRTKSNDFID